MKKVLVFLVLTFAASVAANAQTIDPIQLDNFAHAIAKAEGFGIKGTIPTRYHNPGDLKENPYQKWEGQRGIGKGGHVIFKNDAAGFAALRHQIELALNGKSKMYNGNMTIKQVAHRYAANWRVWAKNVSDNMEVTSDVKLMDLVYRGDPVVKPQILMADFLCGDDYFLPPPPPPLILIAQN